jgi:dihydrodipicolinate synthase/N-acetylneuraminate lyase
MAIPAHPLALTAARRLDERRQRALTRYYLDAGAGGIAVGVHTTQFGIRDPRVGLYRPVLELAAETATEWEARRGTRRVRIAGVIGRTRQALQEAAIARDLGYDVALFSLAQFARATDAELIAHCRRVAQVMPVMGFYLQPAVGGRVLSENFWHRFAEIEQVVAIKVAPFDRYATLDVIRGVVGAGRAREVALYTGNDDSIVSDLWARHGVAGRGKAWQDVAGRGRAWQGVAGRGKAWQDVAGRGKAWQGGVRMVGGLLGHWAYWTRNAVRLVERAKREASGGMSAAMLRLAADTTDANGAIFDAANGFRGCIPGIHEILRRQGLLRGRWCLDRREELSPGQMGEIDRVLAVYPHLTDDTFVRANLDRWLA